MCNRLLIFLLFIATAASAQTVEQMLRDGDTYATKDQHAQAIEAYENAIARDPSIRTSVLPKLARQHLWANHYQQAIDRFNEYLAAKPTDCEIRMDLGLAFQWKNDTSSAEREYQRAQQECPQFRASAADRELTLLRKSLWAGDLDGALPRLKNFVERYPQDCGGRMSLALAYSWHDDLRQASDLYSQIEHGCPDARQDAALARARVYRWQDRPGRAAEIYRTVRREGNSEQQRSSEVGNSLVALAQDRNRSALAQLTKLQTQSPNDPDVIEALAAAQARLGDRQSAILVLDSAQSQGITNPRLAHMQDELRRSDAIALSPSVEWFHDADGTDFVRAVGGISTGWLQKGRMEFRSGYTSLSDPRGPTIRGTVLGGAAEQRINTSFGLRGSIENTSYSGIDFNALTGEADAVITPTDWLRVDATVARLTIADNRAALENHLLGTMGGIGADFRVTDHDTLAASFDQTHWSEGNNRSRTRFSLAHRFEGRPRVTFVWPVLYQHYDQGFSFGLFSPRDYVETAPGVEIMYRLRQHWQVSGNVKAGVQRESGGSAKPLTGFRAALERDLFGAWGMNVAYAWTNSNVASSTGFRRSSVTASLTRRF